MQIHDHARAEMLRGAGGKPAVFVEILAADGTHETKHHFFIGSRQGFGFFLKHFHKLSANTLSSVGRKNDQVLDVTDNSAVTDEPSHTHKGTVGLVVNSNHINSIVYCKPRLSFAQFFPADFGAKSEVIIDCQFFFTEFVSQFIVPPDLTVSFLLPSSKGKYHYTYSPESFPLFLIKLCYTLTMKLLFAPMEGITTCAFRNAYAAHFTGIDRYYTPFLTCSNLKGKELFQVAPENNKGYDLVPQILTSTPELFIGLAGQLYDLGYSEVNLNLGCPSGTVVRKGHGAGFLAHPEELEAFLDKIFEKTTAEISVKTRIGMETPGEWHRLLEIYQKYPIKELIIHPRYGRQMYKGEPDLSAFAEAVKAYAGSGSSTGLCYNGDILTPGDVYKTIKRINEYLKDDNITLPENTGIMIGRGLLMNPFLAADIKTVFSAGTIFTDCNSSLTETSHDDNRIHHTSRADRSEIKAFLSDIRDCYLNTMTGGETPVLMKLKEIWTWLGKGLELEKDRYKAVLKCKTLADYNAVVNGFLI